MSVNSITNSERVTLRFRGLAFCPLCDKAVELLSFGEAARSYNTDVQDITWLAENGELHRLHDRHANLMICGSSLTGVFENRRTRLLDSHFENAMSAGGRAR